MSSTTGLPFAGRFLTKQPRAGYQGLSFRCAIHRQSAQKGKSSHTGLPSAPARCATIVSTEITASMCAIVAATSMMELHSALTIENALLRALRHFARRPKQFLQTGQARCGSAPLRQPLKTEEIAQVHRRYWGEPDAIASLKRAGRFPRDRPVQFAPTGTSAFTLSGSADETLGADEMLADERPPRSISMRPLQYAPSSMLI